MSLLSSLFGRCLGQRVHSTIKRQGGRRKGLRLALEELERRDVPSTFVQVVTTPNYPTVGSFDAVSVTVNGTQYQYAGIQFGAKLAGTASALPGNGVPDFYAFCVDITQSANLTSPYQVATTTSASLPNGAAIAYLYDTYNTPVASPLDKTHAAALQLAIWEEEYGTNIVTPGDVSFMNNYNGTAETTNLLNDAAAYRNSVPSNPTSTALVYSSASGTDQSLIGPPGNEVSVTKVDNKGGSSITGSVGTVVPGTSFTYTVTVSNAGPATATNVSVDDPVPSQETSFDWSGNGQTNVSGAIIDTIASLAPGSSVVYTVTATASPSATGTLSNTVTVNSANNINPNNTTATDIDNLTPQNDVGVTKVDSDGGSSITGSVGSVTPGSTFTYTVTVNNAGPSTATNVMVSDPVPSGESSFIWSGNGHTSVSGAISDTIASLAPGATVVYTVTATASPSATGQLTNTVTVTTLNDTNPNNNTATDIDKLTPQTGVTVTKVDSDGGSSITGSVGSVVPGTSFTYTITVSNAGPSTATNVAVNDAVPSGETSFVWSGNGHTNVSGAISDTIASLASGASVVYTVQATASASATGQLTNTVTVSAPGNTNPNTTATDIDNLTPQNNVDVTKVDNKGGSSITGSVGSVVPGSTFTYTITVYNLGPSTATNIVVNDPVPSQETSFIWSGNGHTNVSGPIIDTIASLPVGSPVVYTVQATVSPSATGTLSNTVGITGETASTGPTATDTDTLTPQNNTSVTKVDSDGGSSITGSIGTVVPGTSFTYTITVTNTGPSTATNVAVTDPVPSQLTSFVWSGNGHTNVSGAISDTIASLAPGASVVYTVQATASPSATGKLTNIVTVNAPNNTNPNNNTGIPDIDNLTPQNDVGVTKVDSDGGSSITGSVGSVTPGSTFTYTVTVSNTGPSTATNVAINDAVPSQLTSFVWSGNGHTSVSGAISDTIASLAPGATVVYTVTATASPSATGTLSNTVTVTAANDTNPNNNSATDTDNLTPTQNNVGVTKVDNKGGSSITGSVGAIVPGSPFTYTITVSNAGSNTATNVAVNDTVPIGLTSFVWSGNGHTNVSGAISDTIASLASGASVVYTVQATAGPSATGTLTNLVAVSVPNNTNPNTTATDIDNLTPQNDVSVTKVDNKGGSSITGSVGSIVPGSTFTYTITVANAGPSTATNVAVSDTVPSQLTSFVWSGDGHTNVTGAITDTIAALAPGATVVYTVTATASSSASGNLSNTVTVSSAGDTNPNNNSATDIDNLTPQNSVSVTKVDNAGGSSITGSVGSVVPGSIVPFVYTITVTNSGPNTATNVLVNDPFPSGITNVHWTGTDGSSGSGPIADTIASLAPGATVTYTVSSTVSPSATGQLVNVVTVSAPNNTSTNTTATDIDNLTPQNFTNVTKVDNKGGSSITGSVGSVMPGSTFTYTIVVTNAPPAGFVGAFVSTATNVLVNDPFPPAITSDTWTGSDGSSGSGPIVDTIGSLLPYASVTYTVTANVSSSATGQLVNVVTVKAANNNSPSSSTIATDIDNLTAPVDLAVEKTDNGGGVFSSSTNDTTGGSYTPGTTTVYTIVVSNNGPDTATGATILDTLPAPISGANWTFDSATGGAVVTGASSGSGGLSTTANLPNGSTLTFTENVVFASGATGNQTNTVTVTPPSGVTDSNPNNNTSTDTLSPAVMPPPCPDNYYPVASSDPLTDVAFNESEIFAGITPSDGTSVSLANGHIDVFYNDETAMTLGVSQITIKKSSGTTTTNYPITPFAATDSGGAGTVMNPQVGAPYTPPATPVTESPSTLALQGGTDASGRPLAPSLYITDITNDLNSHAGDWQEGGTPIAPTAIYGTWKTATETIDETNPNSPQITLSEAKNPSQNGWDLGSGADPVPADVVAASQGQQYSAELQWNVSSLGLLPGHSYRFYVIIHDGDQNKVGGDAGQGCVNLLNTSTPAVEVGGLVQTEVTAAKGKTPATYTGINGVTLTLTGTTSGTNIAVTDHTTTSGNGAYGFTEPPGTYTVTVDSSNFAAGGALAGYVGNQSNSSGTTPATLTVGESDTTIDFTYQKNVPQLAKGTANTVGFSELLNSTSTLKPGQITVAVNLPKGPQAAAEAAAIVNALATYNASLKPLGIHFVEVSGAQAASAQVHINMATTTAIGGMAQGVLGDFSMSPAENITLVEGWNWYFGANPSKIGANQYDFQSVVSHELGHALGLGENDDPNSAMDLFLAAGQIQRNLAAEDLSAIAEELARKPVPAASSSIKAVSTKK